MQAKVQNNCSMSISINYTKRDKTTMDNEDDDSNENSNVDDEDEDEQEEEDIGEIQTPIETVGETITSNIIAKDAKRLATEIVKGVSDKNINFLRLMDAVKNDYLGGLKLLISRTISNDESGWFGVLQWADIGNAKLVTNNVELNKDGIFVIKEEYFFDKKSIYFRLINDVRNNVIKWEWSFNKNSWVDVIKSFDQNDWKDFSRATEYFSIIEELKKSNDIYSGAIILFNLNS